MKKKKYNIFILCFVVVAIAATAIWYYVSYKEEPKEGVIINEHSTNGPGYYEDDIPHADPVIVGKWRSTEKKGWYKVYYDDYDEDAKLFWGKEWDEEDDVQEEDLNYHGNGWFRWEKRGKGLHEYATMDARDVPIYNGYKLLLSTPDTLVYCDKDHKHIVFHFSRVK